MKSIFFILLASLSSAHADETNPMSAELSTKSCKVHVDSKHIPHINAPDQSTLFSCIGYYHGRDRAWQMDFLRRIFQGRKAELLGKDEIKKDFMMRILDLDGRAKKIWLEFKDEDRKLLWSYVHGVNLGFTQYEKDGSSYEQRYFKNRIDAWQPSDTIGVLLLQALDQTRKSFEEQLREQKRLAKHREKSVDLFNPDGMPWETTILKDGEYPKAEKSVSTIFDKTAEKIFSQLQETLPSLETGSNSWIVAPSRTKSGKAMLANDPHLSLKHPPFWYMAHLSFGKSFDAFGVTLPGAPIIASGANQGLAWGLTNSYMNSADVAFIPETEIVRETKRPLVWFKFGPLQ